MNKRICYIPCRLKSTRLPNKCLKKIEQTYVDGKGNQKISCKTLVSQKGLEFIRRLLNDEINGE